MSSGEDRSKSVAAIGEGGLRQPLLRVPPRLRGEGCTAETQRLPEIIPLRGGGYVGAGRTAPGYGVIRVFVPYV